SCFPEFQYVLLNEEQQAIACGNAISFNWCGNEANLPEGWDNVLEKGMVDLQNNIQPNTLSALAIIVHPDYRGMGLSKIMIKKMKNIAKVHDLKNMIAPVRPSLKSMYPLIAMKDYLS